VGVLVSGGSVEVTSPGSVVVVASPEVDDPAESSVVHEAATRRALVASASGMSRSRIMCVGRHTTTFGSHRVVKLWSTRHQRASTIKL